MISLSQASRTHVRLRSRKESSLEPGAKGIEGTE